MADHLLDQIINLKLYQLYFNHCEQYYNSQILYICIINQYCNMGQFGPKSKYFMLIVFLLIIESNSYCSTGCTYAYQSGSGNYLAKCTSTTSSSCTACDTLFYSPTPSPAASGTCSLLSQNIYNSSARENIAQSSWYVDYNPLTVVSFITVGGNSNWINLGTTSIYTTLIYKTQAYYGLRCRVLFHASNRNNDYNINFIVNNTYSYNVQNIPATDAQYNHLQWIYTTPFIAFSDPVVRLNIQRTDSSGTTVGFNDVLCFFAQCTPNCLSCTSTTNCDSCASGFLLDVVTKLCLAACPLGLYSTGGTCQLCDVRCTQCSGTSTTCSSCTSAGPYESYLELSGTTCSATCSVVIANHLSHKCQCPAINTTLFGGACLACPTNCKYCTGSPTTCLQCHLGYFMINGTTTCSPGCPAGQYVNLNFDLKRCYLCDTTLCVQCINSSSMCTSCSFLTANRYLYNYTCLYLCPDGYEANNITFKCDLCPLGMYSFENVCYTQCPQYYTANEDIRACVVPGGYPINMTIQVEGANTLKFTIPFIKSLSNTNVTLLSNSWISMISLAFVTQNTSSLILNKRRTLTQVFSRTVAISNAVISSTSIILYTTSIDVTYLVFSHSFVATFSDNLLSPKNVVYAIKATASTDSNPWVVSQYFDVNIKPFFLIGAFLAIFGLLMILMRTKYVYRLLIQYLHCIQLLGLTFYAIYPHALHVDMYSFTMGLDFANFSFLYNVAAKFIAPCTDCTCLVSYNFAIGDMNWIRMMSPLLLCLIAMLIFTSIIYAFKCSRGYTQFYLTLIVDLIIVKALHGWFTSLLYSGLNFDYDNVDLDLFILSMHLFSYLLLIPVIYTRLKAQLVQKHVNISFVFLIIDVILITLLSIAPSIICGLLIFTAFTQWCLNIGLDIGEDQKPRIKELSQITVQGTDSTKILIFHNHLLRSFKPITAFLISIIMLADNQVVPIASVSSVIGLMFILIIVSTYFQYEYHQKLAKIQVKSPHKSKEMINQTKQDLKMGDNITQYKQIKQNKQVKIFDQDDVDDGVVGKRFRKSKAQAIHTSSVPSFYKNQQLIKNL